MIIGMPALSPSPTGFCYPSPAEIGLHTTGSSNLQLHCTLSRIGSILTLLMYECSLEKMAALITGSMTSVAIGKASILASVNPPIRSGVDPPIFHLEGAQDETASNLVDSDAPSQTCPVAVTIPMALEKRIARISILMTKSYLPSLENARKLIQCGS